MVVTPGSPPLCAKLVDSASLRGLSLAIDDVAVNGASGKGGAGLRQAALDLRAAADLVDGAVKAALVDAAGALDVVATSGLVDPDAATELSQRLTFLGEEVQTTCHFPIG